MRIFEIEKWDKKNVQDWTTDKKKNPYITDTAGFVPLQVQIQKFEQSGIRARFRSEMFDSSDFRDMYLQPDLMINSEDDEIDIQEKLDKQRFVKEQIFRQKAETGERQKFENIMRDYEELKRREAELKRQIDEHDIPNSPPAGTDEAKK